MYTDKKREPVSPDAPDIDMMYPSEPSSIVNPIVMLTISSRLGIVSIRIALSSSRMQIACSGSNMPTISRLVGLKLGASVGDAVGTAVGSAVGFNVGEIVGSDVVGNCVGLSVGADVQPSEEKYVSHKRRQLFMSSCKAHIIRHSSLHVAGHTC